jgi:hypothetical protein
MCVSPPLVCVFFSLWLSVYVAFFRIYLSLGIKKTQRKCSHALFSSLHLNQSFSIAKLIGLQPQRETKI